MTPITDNSFSSQHEALRHAADSELNTGNLDINSGWTLPAETLGLLYNLASDPKSAADALKLLHELQTHQVELELQYRQLLINEQFIKQQLNKFKSLLDLSSIGYIMADAQGQIMEMNTAATSLLNISDHAVIGMPVNNFFKPQAHSSLGYLFDQLAKHDDGADVVCIISAEADDSSEKQLKITGSISVADNAVMITIMEFLPSQPN